MKKKLIALLCIVSLCVTNVMPAFATENTDNTDVTENALESMSVKKVNPLYADVISEEDLNEVLEDVPVLYAEETVYEQDITAIGATIRTAMVNRTKTFQICVQTETDIESDEALGAYVASLVEAAFAETENPNEGDYLRWQYGGYVADVEGVVKNNTSYLTISMAFTYYTTAAQEAVVDEKIDDVLNEQLNLDEDNLSDYEKTKAIYDYICENVVYDYDNLEDDNYTLKYTAYAALVDKTSVCQGYAVLFYRMLEEVDIEARVVGGIGNGGPHGWNISELDEKYYYSDATWDAPRKVKNMDYEYFLKGSEEFEDHTPDSDSPAYQGYDISETTYGMNEGPEDEPENGTDDGTEDVCTNHVSDGICTDRCDATCTESGYEIYHCESCETEMRTELPANGHTEVTDAAVAATCTTAGKTAGSHCSVCGEVIEAQEVVAAKGHSYGSWITSKEASCTATGIRYIVCACGDKIEEVIEKTAHNWNSNYTVDKTPSCTVEGSKSIHCADCSATKNVTTIKATGHTYKVKTVNKKATTTKDGKITKQCTVCQKTFKPETLYRAKSVSLSKTKFAYNGKTQKPTVVVKDSKGKVISSSNYKVSFSKGCKNVGTYKVTVKFKGQYSGTLTKTFKITKAKPKITASNFIKKVGDKAFSINAKISPKGGKVTYKTSNKKIATVSSKGKVTIKKAGKVTITITSAASKNCNKATKKITVNVKKK